MDKIENKQQDDAQDIEKPTIEGPQSTSMVEDAEMGGSASCVTNCEDSSGMSEPKQEDIKDNPMVAKAIELFEANKITIQSKI